MNWWEAAIAVLGGIVLIYAVLLVLLAVYARKHPETVGMRKPYGYCRICSPCCADWPPTRHYRAGSVFGWSCCWLTS